MIKNLRKKIFWSIELSAMGILLVILVVYNGIHYAQREREKWAMLSTIMDTVTGDFALDEEYSNDKDNGNKIPDVEKGRLPKRGKKMTSEIVRTLVSGEVGIVEMNSDGSVLSVSGFLGEYEEEQRNTIISKIRSQEKERGKTGKLKYVMQANGTYTYIVMLDAGYIDTEVLQMAGISLLGLLLAGLLFGILARGLSVRIAAPVEETIRNQKQFIADASHELKTPVAVIVANISVLEKEIGKSRWLDYIKEEGERMTSLVSNLLQLSKLDYEQEEMKESRESIAFDAVPTVLETALPFESVAFEQGLSYDIQVPETAMAYGRPEDLKQIIGILLDNALKHAEQSGSVILSARQMEIHKNRKTQHLLAICVSNTGAEIPDEALPYLFNRFYKLDASRKYKENSFGLGLAIAKALTGRNGGDISVVSRDHVTEFTVLFPQE